MVICQDFHGKYSEVTFLADLSQKMHWYCWQDDTLLLQLHVQTRTHHDEFKGLLDDRLCPIPKLPGNAGFKVQIESQSKAQLAVNDWSFIRVVTRHWLSTLAPAGQDEKQPPSSF